MRYLLIIGLFCLVSESLGYRGYKSYWKKKKPMCAPVKCDEMKCIEAKGPDGCPMCKCEPMCVPPVCKLPCKLIVEDVCPKCVCEKDDDELDIDARKDPKGMIDMKPKCLPPKCPPGCEIENFFEGPCPGCLCKEMEEEEEEEEEMKKIPAQIACSPPKCPPGCKLQKVFKGPCPGCDCKEDEEEFFPEIACSIPKCPPGCKLETEFKGPCPGCDCKEPGIPANLKIPKKKFCAPVKCMPGCEEFKEGPEDCPRCKCKPVCVPPKCGYGCELDKDPKAMCPGCICKKDKKIEKEILMKEIKEKCPYVEKCFKPGCKLVEDEKGCKFCKCGPICDPPKCPRRCIIKVMDGPCPECVCPVKKWWAKKPSVK